MPKSLAQFIHRENVRRYNDQLAMTQSGQTRSMLLSLLAAEMANTGGTARGKPKGGRELDVGDGPGVPPIGEPWE